VGVAVGAAAATAAAAAAAGVEDAQEARPWAMDAAMAYDDIVDPREIRNAAWLSPASGSGADPNCPEET